jgi:hypothetical protein
MQTTDVWSKEVNSRPGQESQQHGWEIHKEIEILKRKQRSCEWKPQ